ncbi:MAG TPA: enolase C-terminal domain-like protein [Acidimicrobiales bacterium]|nr:enolase C-terminal domain-like protein [Acidimicrobiales bacterium]
MTEGLRRHDLLLGGRRVTLVEGPYGWGESSPLPGYPCDPGASMAAALEAAGHPWPPLVRPAVPVNALVSGPGFDPAALVGFPCVKVKVGRGDPRLDLDLVAAVRRAVGPSVALRVDANGAWDEETAQWVLTRLASGGIELAEQPVAGLEALARLRRRVPVPLAADESVRSVDDARRLRRLSAADVVVLKVQALGGMWPALAVAEAAGVPAVVTSMMETSVGTATGLHLAAALPELPLACGLATAGVAGADVTRRPLVAEDGVLRVRTVVPDDDLLSALAEPGPVHGVGS